MGASNIVDPEETSDEAGRVSERVSPPSTLCNLHQQLQSGLVCLGNLIICNASVVKKHAELPAKDNLFAVYVAMLVVEVGECDLQLRLRVEWLRVHGGRSDNQRLSTFGICLTTPAPCSGPCVIRTGQRPFFKHASLRHT